jgi:hypothetical protein
MHIDISSKAVAIEIASPLLVAPFIVWFALSIALRKWTLHPEVLLPWFVRLRWLAWTCAMVLYVSSAGGGYRLRIFGSALIAFTAGLAFPEGWLRKRIAASHSTS